MAFVQQELRPGCPITRQDLAASRQRRRWMRARGYPPLAAHSPWSPYVDPARAGKQPLTEMHDGVKSPWGTGHSETRQDKVTPASANTGLLLGGERRLVALDIDPPKAASPAERQAFACDVLGLILRAVRDARNALIRLRRPGSVLLLMRADRSMTKLRVIGQRGAAELLADGQQCVVDGWHPASLAGDPVRWFWYRDRAPWNVPIDELPVVPADTLRSLMERLAASGVLGAPVMRPVPAASAAVRPGRASSYAATGRLHQLFERHGGLVKPAIRELVAEVGAAGCGRHDSIVAIAGRLVHQRWADDQVLDWLTPLINRAFQDGDWSAEIQAALAHARRRDAARLTGFRGVVWPA